PARPDVPVQGPDRRLPAAGRGAGDRCDLRGIPRRLARARLPAFAQLHRQPAGLRRGAGLAGHLRGRRRARTQPGHRRAHGRTRARNRGPAARGRSAAVRDDRGLRTRPGRAPRHALRPCTPGGPARLPRRARTRRAAAPARRGAVLDAALLHRRGAARPARPRHRARDPRGDHVRRQVRAWADLSLAPGARLREGDGCVLFNGDGHDYAARIVEAGKRSTVIEVLDATPVDNESPLRVTLVQGIARGEKMDLVLQKATELGVDRIVPVNSERSEVKLDGERLERRVAHWRAVLASACEQCGRARLPRLDAPVALASVGGLLDPGGLRITLDPQGAHALPGLAPRLPADGSGTVVVAVGPEGGWAPRDRDRLQAAGFEGLRLGPRVLRTET